MLGRIGRVSLKNAGDVLQETSACSKRYCQKDCCQVRTASAQQLGTTGRIGAKKSRDDEYRKLSQELSHKLGIDGDRFAVERSPFNFKADLPRIDYAGRYSGPVKCNTHHRPGVPFTAAEHFANSPRLS